VRGSHLRRLASRVDPLAATPGDIVGFMVANSHLKPESRKSLISSMRLFYAWARAGGLVASDPTAGLGPVHVPPSVPRPISDVDLRSAFVTADEEVTLMLLLGCYAGLRRAEIAAVHSDDVDGLSLTVCGKGGRTRRIPVHPMLAGRLARVHGWAFPSPVRIGEHVGPDYVAGRLEVALPPPWTAHSLRHYFATKAYQGSHDIRAVQQLLGHSSLATTQRYVLVDDEAMRAAVLAVA
jgi:site-specific recombinase XerD